MHPERTVQATLDQKPARDYNAHIVSIKWDGHRCHWLYYDLGKRTLKKYYPAVGKRFDIHLSDEMICVGDHRLEKYAICPNQTKVNRTSQCRVCSKTLIDLQECIFEPRCHGKRCAPTSEICREEHAVYLAFYGRYPKVGLTLLPRLHTRLIEQGADAYSHVKVLPDRLAARELETKIGKRFKIPERVHPNRVLSLMKEPLNEEIVREEYLLLKGRIKKELGFSLGGLQWLREYPFKTLRTKPRKRDTPGGHNGTVLGLKGKYLLYENNGINALNMFQMPARFASFK